MREGADEEDRPGGEKRRGRKKRREGKREGERERELVWCAPCAQQVIS